MIFLKKGERVTKPSALTVGMFDGLHLGHRELIGQLKKTAGELKTILFTFQVADESGCIYTAAEKKELLQKMGLDYAYLQESTPEFFATKREDFLFYLKDRYNMKSITVGEDFRFGSGAMGDAPYLCQNAERFEFAVHVVPPVVLDGNKVSSTRIRGLIAAGSVREAARLLGGYYFASGRVEQGNRLGSQMDFPTINIKTPKMKPANGMYATFTQIGGRTYESVTNVGVRPTVSKDNQNIETNIFDFNDKIYDKEVAVYFVEKIRDEKKFGGISELKSQISRDKQAAAEFLGNKNVYKPEWL